MINKDFIKKFAAGKLTESQLNTLLPTDKGVLRALGGSYTGTEYVSRRNAIAQALAESIDAEEKDSYAIREPLKYRLLAKVLGGLGGAALGAGGGHLLDNSGSGALVGGLVGGLSGILGGNLYAKKSQWNKIKSIKNKYMQATSHDPEKVNASKDIGLLPYNVICNASKLQTKDLLKKVLKEDINIHKEYDDRFGDPTMRRGATLLADRYVGNGENHNIRRLESLLLEPRLAKKRLQYQGIID